MKACLPGTGSSLNRIQTKMMGVAVTPVGRLSKRDRLSVKGVGGRQIIDVTVDELREAFHSGFQG